MPWRARWRRRVFRFRFPAIIGENPLEVGLITWATFAGLNAVTSGAPSNALRSLPDPLEYTWAVLMIVAAVTVGVALWKRLDHIVASGMYLFAATLVSYSLAVLGSTGWSRGATVAVLLFILGTVCFLRGWWLKEDEARLIRHTIRKRRREFQ